MLGLRKIMREKVWGVKELLRMRGMGEVEGDVEGDC